MKNLILLLTAIAIAICMFSCKQPANQYIEPINPNATQKAKNLYYFLQDVKGTYTLSGMHNFCGKGSENVDFMQKLFGKKPIVWGSDFSFCAEGDSAFNYQHCGPANMPSFSLDSMMKRMADTTIRNRPKMKRVSEFLDITLEEARNLMIEEAKKRYADGHMITLMWHGCFPTEGDCCDGSSIWAMENRPSPEQWDSLVTEGTELNKAWKEGADKIASYLKQLQDANIPVLWRPYHEMNGVWFWWCNQKGDQGFKRLWIMMYDYFTNHHKLNNLIWVWDANAPRDIPGDEAFAYDLFYPGNEYVDVLAADVYHEDWRQSHHDQLVTLGEGKPIALGEVGSLPAMDTLMKQPQWTWFMPWGGMFLMRGNPEEMKAFINSDKVLMLDEISVDEKGVYTIINDKKTKK